MHRTTPRPILALALGLLACGGTDGSPVASAPSEAAPPPPLAPPFTCSGEAFVTLSTPTGGTTLQTVDLSGPIAFVPLGAGSMSLRSLHLGFRDADGYMYGIEAGAGAHNLYRVASDGSFQDLGEPVGAPLTGDFFGAEVLTDGVFAAVDDSGQLARIDVTTEPPTLLDLTPLTYPDGSAPDGVFDLAADPISGDLYAFDSRADVFIQIDVATGAVAPFGPVHAGMTAGSAFFDEQGRFYVYASAPGSGGGSPQENLYRVDLVTGDLTLQGQGPAANGSDGTFCRRACGTDAVLAADLGVPLGDDLLLELTDPDLNIAAGIVEQADVEVRNPTTGDAETVVLLETGPDTGVFAGSVPTSADPAFAPMDDGTLYASVGDALAITFVDRLTTVCAPVTVRLDVDVDPPSAPGCFDTPFLTLSTVGGGTQLHAVDLSAGAPVFTPLGSPDPSISSLHLGFNPVDGVMYGVEAGPSGQQLYQVDVDGTFTALGDPVGAPLPRDIYAAEVLSDGTLAILSAGGRLRAIDLSMSPPRVVRSRTMRLPDGTKVRSILDIAEDRASGLLYGFEDNIGRMVTIEPGAGLATPFGPTYPDLKVGSAWFDETGRLFLYGNDRGLRRTQDTLFEVDVATGALTVVGSGTFANGSDAAFCLQ